MHCRWGLCITGPLTSPAVCIQTCIAQTLHMQLGGVVVGLGLILGHMTKYIHIHARHMYCCALFAQVQVLMSCRKSCMMDLVIMPKTLVLIATYTCEEGEWVVELDPREVNGRGWGEV